MTIIILAGALFVLAITLKTLSKIDTDKVATSLGLLAGLMIGMVLLSIAVSKAAPSLTIGSGVIMAYAASLLILVFSLKMLGTIKPDKLLIVIELYPR